MSRPTKLFMEPLPFPNAPDATSAPAIPVLLEHHISLNFVVQTAKNRPENVRRCRKRNA